ncbi:MAG: hypothetical protein WBQ21_01885, partial [Solirubrobacteraceae bacterium]
MSMNAEPSGRGSNSHHKLKYTDAQRVHPAEVLPRLESVPPLIVPEYSLIEYQRCALPPAR